MKCGGRKPEEEDRDNAGEQSDGQGAGKMSAEFVIHIADFSPIDMVVSL